MEVVLEESGKPTCQTFVINIIVVIVISVLFHSFFVKKHYHSHSAGPSLHCITLLLLNGNELLADNGMT